MCHWRHKPIVNIMQKTNAILVTVNKRLSVCLIIIISAPELWFANRTQSAPLCHIHFACHLQVLDAITNDAISLIHNDPSLFIFSSFPLVSSATFSVHISLMTLAYCIGSGKYKHSPSESCTHIGFDAPQTIGFNVLTKTYEFSFFGQMEIVLTESKTENWSIFFFIFQKTFVTESTCHAFNWQLLPHAQNANA